ncbi:MAG: SDR family NAD(P)-dependent oxidoreductase [Tabrizicola sp.]|uniref:SDR family NAD(P)-dependent oxidoreductase n=1 Tax=Tabrizicola sp. TaxID=2005166 RepID=UPI00273755DC|nr:SDR family NAD(P)-dependent oxidoreductase [Tabrizicola sp.]MDP3261399.1 SDR family NAD(P)-dependent oxidoreductase [Tabrizicola sp.]MDP3649188.1 SDR family NAD(P)-dependent oxidoreductase [Paracoccaceae bacterium]
MEIVFHDKTALVTGAGSGIGEAVAKGLAASGARVLVQDLNLAAATRVANEIAATGGLAKAAGGDVSDPAVVEGLVAQAVEWGSGLHLLVNNAGIAGPSAPVGEYPVDGWNHVMNVNLNAVFYGMRYAIPAMLQAGGGAIVNMASILGSVGFANAAAYTSAKHALLGLTRAAALEYSAKGIRVNAIGPAFIETPLLSALPPGAKEALITAHPIGRLGRPEEVADLTQYLLSDKASFITGSYHLVDGGYCAQ